MKPDGQTYFSTLSPYPDLFSILGAIPLGILVLNKEGSCVYSNPAYRTLSGQSSISVLGIKWRSAIHINDRKRVIAGLHLSMCGNRSFNAEMRLVQKAPDLLWVRARGEPIDAGKFHGYVLVFESLSEFKTMESLLVLAEQKLLSQQGRAQVVLNSIGDAVLATDVDGDVSYLNRVAETMTGWSAKDGIGQPLAKVFKVIDAHTRQSLPNIVSEMIKDNKISRFNHNCLLIRPDGSETPIEDSVAPIYNQQHEMSGAVIVFNDVGHARALAQKMMDIAQHDPLTGLVTRVLLTERLGRAFILAKRKNNNVGLLYIDVDNFKKINDSLGHAAGDELLKMVAGRLLGLVRASDTVCRQGGDEFVILLTEIDHYYYAGKVAAKIISAFQRPHTVQGKELVVTLSIGISVYPVDCRDAESAYKNADEAMYLAKKMGRNNYQFYSESKTSKRVFTGKRGRTYPIP